ncbi:hypothetical protein LUZ60_007821 [Juncus effusus]|nr:hypothetical protein LUZ60_007821 [Juncus effusus]
MTYEEEERGKLAIKRALRALRRRHLVEEGAHGPAIEALSKPFTTQVGSCLQSVEWKEKAEKLEVELQEYRKAQLNMSAQLDISLTESRTAKNLLQEKESLITNLQNNLNQTSEENLQLKEDFEEKRRAVELLISENQTLKSQLEDILTKLRAAEAENKNLIDRWMLEKMKDAERLNEANAMYEEMVEKLRSSGIGPTTLQQTAQQQSDGVIRRFETGHIIPFATPLPSTHKLTLQAHQGGCGSLKFMHNSDRLVSGGQDRMVRIWDGNYGTMVLGLSGSVGSILDLAVTGDNKFVIGACSSNNLCVWETGGGRLRHTLTGHVNKVCSVDANRDFGSGIASASLDHTIKIWDLNSGYCVNTIMSSSNCNSLAFVDRDTICSGHVDGNLRIWDVRKGKCTSQVAAHPQVTSVCVPRSGNSILTTGRDNIHNLFDIRTLEICGSFRSNSSSGGWGRPCMSPDGNNIAAGSSDGLLHIWSKGNKEPAKVLEGHGSGVLCCEWSERGGVVASADRNGNVFIWT